MDYSVCEPIAIIGMGCRFPGGASNPKAFWKLLCDGKDAIVDVPKDRWDVRRFYDPDPDKPGKTYVKQGGFLREKIDHFDPLFFGISPREAESMDPQQRLLLEVCWEAFEDGGLDIANLAGSKTGVFIGGFCLDHQLMNVGQLNRELANVHTAASSTLTILANRISYIFDFHGPSVTMDTACSSSLVTTHHACQSLWDGESELAITGGVNVMLRPEFPIVMSKGRFLSEHGRCMAFDARASGYTRGEGAGIAILKPLNTALRDKDRIYALIKMTGVNQDGHTPGITMPNAEAQENLIREVYDKANISPAAIQYVEAHGTGTQAGDPKELQALNSVLIQDRNDQDKCRVGSVKTNIGHLEAAAGIAGLMKASLSLHKNKIPPNLHFEEPNPDIPFAEMCLRIPTSLEDWPAGNSIRYAGVNSFGYGGTNAHVLLQEAPLPSPQIKDKTKERPAKEIQRDKPFLVPVSARSDTALKEFAGRYAFYITSNSTDKAFVDFLYSASLRRTHHNNRLSLVARSVEELREKLQHSSSGDYVEYMTSAVCDLQKTPRLVFIYTGMGPQWWAMGRELMAQEPTFINSIKHCDEHFKIEAGWSILEALQADESESQITKTEVAQPANFVIQVALTELWKERGITPDAVIGHSVGEVASAYISGALSLGDAIKVSVHRSRLQSTLAGQGSMLAVSLTEQNALEIIENYKQVSIAAINGPSAVTLSGDEDQLQTIANTLQEQEIFNRLLQVEVAYHSRQMETIQAELQQCLASIKPQATKIPLYSTVTGELIDGTTLDADYWWRNVRQPVRFADGIKTLLSKGFENYLEIGPHPVLGNSVKEIAAAAGSDVQLVPSLNRKFPEPERMLESLGQLYTLGFSPDWQAVIPHGGQFVSLPNYPWQRERYWRESQASIQDRIGQPGHVFLNQRLPVPQPTWSVEINEQFFPFIKDHRVNNEIVFPGAAYVEAGLAVHSVCTEGDVRMLADLQFHNILFVEPQRVQELSINYDEKTQCFTVHSRFKEDEAEWKLHASGRLITENLTSKHPKIDFKKLREQFTNEYPVDDLYLMLSDRGLDYGPHFQNARQLWVTDDEILVRVKTEQEYGQADETYLLHPALLDTAIHSILSVIPGNNPFIPVSINKIVFYSSPGKAFWCHAIVTRRTETSIEADIYLLSDSGQVYTEIKNSLYRVIENKIDHSDHIFEQCCYEPQWVEYEDQDGLESKSPECCLIFAYESPILTGLETTLNEQNVTYTKVIQGGAFKEINNQCFQLNHHSLDEFERLFKALEDKQFTHLYYLWPLAKTHSELISTKPAIDECMTLIYLIQKLISINEKELTLVIFTCGAQKVISKDNVPNLNTSPLWGLGPLIENEHPNIHCRLIDLEPGNSIPQVNSWFDIMKHGKVNDLAFRSEHTFIKKIKRQNFDFENSEQITEKIFTENPVVLELLNPGQLDSLVYRKTERQEPRLGEIEIKIQYVALNFKDVLKAYDSLPEKVTQGTYFGTTIGIEVAGKVTRVGENVSLFKEGDEVVAAIAGSFRSFATIPTKFVILKLDTLKPEESPIYVTHLTAYYSLVEIANLQAGEKILIHSAAGGLGLVSIQIAQWLGAEIFATAGTEEKRDYLRSLGIDHVMDSHTLDFVDQINYLTQGSGVDVVLNSLAGEALKQSFNLLAPYGRFIEVGKTDIISNSGLPMAPFNRNITFSSVDLDRIYAEKPELIVRLVNTVAEYFNKGYFSAIPTKVFSADKTIDAFRYMAQGKHIGKIVVKFEDESVDVIAGSKEESIYSPQGSYLITGGTGGFGLEVARWLGTKGVGKLVLISRSGAASEECRQVIADLQAKGTDVEAHAIDVTDYDAVKKLIEVSEQQGPPLRGVIHAATIYNDALIMDMDEEKFSTVIGPKIEGALNLYNCIKSLKLDFFVLFSSISSLMGNRGQANYVAANSFLDEFAHYARAQGCPTISINWGALAEVGIIARNQNINELMQQQGISGLSNQDALKALNQILSSDKSQVGVFDVDWARWATVNPQMAQSTRFRDLVTLATETDDNTLDAKARQRIEELTPMLDEERQEHIETLVRNQLAKILKLSPNKIDTRQDLSNLGIDSLMILELTFTIKDEFGVEITTMSLLKQPTISELTGNIISKLFSDLEKPKGYENSDQEISSLATAG
ncbi:MAG: type I polyketide synthase [Proteobacteria bacterium]|nr:type I polyketide synthase [Pseudomonadota bacterium]